MQYTLLVFSALVMLAIAADTSFYKVLGVSKTASDDVRGVDAAPGVGLAEYAPLHHFRVTRKLNARTEKLH